MGGRERICHIIQLTKLFPVSNDLRATSFILEYFFTLFFFNYKNRATTSRYDSQFTSQL